MPSPQDGGWSWDGSNWVCNPDCPPSQFPPFGPPVFSGPTQQPPWYPGANGGVSFGLAAPANPVRGHLWWDGTTFWLFDGAAWVSISSGASGLKGVIDGSVAAPGMVGEILRNTVTIPVALTANAFTTTFSALVLSAGDWDVQGRMAFSNASAGADFTYADLVLSASVGAITDGQAGIYASFGPGAQGIAVWVNSTNQFAVSANQPSLITGTMQVAAATSTPTATATVLTAARRRR
jgi:hypothetical protein